MNRKRARNRNIAKHSYEKLEPRQMLATIAIQDGSWNDPLIWHDGVPDTSTRAIIPPGISVTLTGTDHFAKELVVQGTLSVEESSGSTKTLSADWIHVNRDGLFQIGTENDRFDESEFVITLKGDDPEAVISIEGVSKPITDETSSLEFDDILLTEGYTAPITNNNGFLMVATGGRLEWFGQEKLSFTKLAATAAAGSDVIYVEQQIDRNFDGAINALDGKIDWRVGDEIVIASSSEDYSEEEVRTITALTDLGSGFSQLALDSPLNHRHYGQKETYSNASRTYELDLRAEVAVLNRTIKIQGEAHHDTDNFFGDRERYNAGIGDGFGGHTMIMASAGQIVIDNVQFDGMGQTSRLGRYPIHWHIAGDRTGDVLRGASITNSNNRGVTVHATHNLLIQDVVLHDIQGHGFFMENGVETGNRFISNIAFGIHKVGRSEQVGNFAPDLNDPFIVDTHDHVGQNANRFLSSSAYWVTNPDNVWIGNISAGSEGTGFWFILPEFAIGDSADDPQYANVNANRTNLRQFDHNSSHASPIGFNFDRGPDVEVPVGAELDAFFEGRRYLPPSEPQFNNYTAYKHRVGIYHRGDIANFHENRFADNFTSTFITFTQRITNTLYVGHSRGNADLGSTVTGHSLYDGANTLSGTHFAGYQYSNAHTFRTHSSALRHTSHVFSSTSFENDGSANNISIANQSGGSTHNDAFGFSPSAVYDQDGTLTGPVGGGAGLSIVTNHPFFYDSNDVRPSGWNAWLSNDLYSMLNVRVQNALADFRFTAPDGDRVTWDDSSFNTVLKNDAGDYVIDFPDGISSVDDGFEILHYTRVGPSGATIIRFDGIAPILAPELNAVGSLKSLRNSNSTVYHRDGNDIWVKFFSSSQRIKFEPAPNGGQNSTPIAIDDFVTLSAGQSFAINVLANDFDPDGDEISLVAMGTTRANIIDEFQAQNPPTGWQYLWNASGEFGDESTYQPMTWDQWRYRPASGNFPYVSANGAHPGNGTGQDPQGIERFAIAAFTVQESGTYAIADSYISVNEGTLDGVNVKAHITGGQVISLGDLYLSTGDFDGTLGYLDAGETIYLALGSNSTAGADGTNWDFSIVQANNPQNGTLEFNPKGTIIYTPDPGFTGSDKFTYQISDGRGGRDTASVSITVEEGSSRPFANHQNTEMEQSAPVTINAPNRNLSKKDSGSVADMLTTSPLLAAHIDIASIDSTTHLRFVWSPLERFSDESRYVDLAWDSFGNSHSYQRNMTQFSNSFTSKTSITDRLVLAAIPSKTERPRFGWGPQFAENTTPTPGNGWPSIHEPKVGEFDENVYQRFASVDVDAFFASASKIKDR